MLGHVRQRLLRDPEQHRVEQLRQFARLAGHAHRDRHRAALVELARQVLERGRQPQGVEQGRPQPVREPADLGQAGIEALQRAGQQRGRAGLLRRFDQQLGRHQRLADAVVQLAREVGPLFLLRAHDLVRQRAQLGLGLAVLAEVERQRAGADQRHAEERDRRDAPHRAGDVGLRFPVELLQRRADAVQVEPRAQHPVPALHRHDVAELGRALAAGRLAPFVVDITAAGLGLRDQLLDGRPPLRIAQAPEVAPDQFRLPRMHQHPALQVIDEEVAVLAVIQRGQQPQRLALVALDVGVAGPGGQRGRALVQRLQRADGQLDVMAQLVAAGVHVGALHGGVLALEQLALLLAHRHRDQQQRGDQRQQRQQQDLQAESHRVLFGPAL